MNFQIKEVGKMASAFADVQTAPPIEVFQLGRDFAADTNPKKVLHSFSVIFMLTERVGQLLFQSFTQENCDCISKLCRLIEYPQKQYV